MCIALDRRGGKLNRMLWTQLQPDFHKIPMDCFHWLPHVFLPHSFHMLPIWIFSNFFCRLGPTRCGLVTCSPCLPSPPTVCSPQVLHVCIGLIDLSLSHCLAHFAIFPVVRRSSYNCLHCSFWCDSVWGVCTCLTHSLHAEKKCCTFNRAIFL